ncbi:MAG: GNAT family N-acetyltransferase [Firmicutes bacterium]|nr:GNAT family N-acetyltransferase [Bacillota bacterium]
MIEAIWKKGTDDLTDAFSLRREVFIGEQGIPEELEFEGDDVEYRHLVVYDDGEPAASGRMRFLTNEEAKIGRICVRKASRGKQIGYFLVKVMMEKAFDEGALTMVVDAQVQAEPFYRICGFKRVCEIEDPTGIPHCRMQADLIRIFTGE